ncbi:MAG: hypothetical protein NZ482_01915 [Gloeomargarita sp. SKYG98]|nr:hypothetical protein [Gloeomargarita sp. SKYG98]
MASVLGLRRFVAGVVAGYLIGAPAGVVHAQGCPRGYRPWLWQGQQQCLPHLPEWPISELFGEVELDHATLKVLHQAFSVPGPVPSRGTLASLPLGVLTGSDPLNLQANFGEIAQGAGLPAAAQAGQIGALRDFVPGQSLREFVAQAYGPHNSFGERRVDGTPIGDELKARLGTSLYELSGVGNVKLRDLPAYSHPAVAEVLAQAAGTRLLTYTLDQLGLKDVLPGRFAWASQLRLGQLFNLRGIPFEKLRLVLEMPVPVPAQMVNAQASDNALTGLVPIINQISGFSCLPGTNQREILAGHPAQTGQSPKADVHLFKNEHLRVGILGKVRCHDASARGVLGALTGYRGFQVVNAWKFGNDFADFIVQVAMDVSVQEMKFESRLKMKVKQQPWRQILGESANGALPFGFRLNPIKLTQTGIVFVPLQDLLQGLLPQFRHAAAVQEALRYLTGR